MITTTNSLAISQFMDRQNNPVCKHCGEHTEKFRISTRRGNVCQKCQKTKNAMKVKLWYYKKKGWTELVKKMNREMETLFGSKSCN